MVQETQSGKHVEVFWEKILSFLISHTLKYIRKCRIHGKSISEGPGYGFDAS